MAAKITEPPVKSYREHKAKWSNCTRCPLHEHRSHVVFVRGTLPCDILFIGEAPGQSEDIIGKPFVGPAGKLLDYWIDTAVKSTYAITNLVGCIPISDDGSKAAEPDSKSIQTCFSKVQEVIALAKPRLLVMLGKLPAKYLDKYSGIKTLTLMHPAAVLRADESSQSLLIQRNQVMLEDAAQDLLVPF